MLPVLPAPYAARVGGAKMARTSSWMSCGKIGWSGSSAVITCDSTQGYGRGGWEVRGKGREEGR